MNIPLFAALFSLTSFFRQGSPTPVQRKNLFHLLIALGTIATLIVSYPLWTSDRAFPTVPFIGEDWQLPLPSTGVFIALLCFTSLSLFIPQRGIMTGLVALFSLIALSEDINRAHPWMWYMLLSFGALAFSQQKDRSFLSTMRILTICIYFWSGLHKIHLNFFDLTWPTMVDALIGNGTIDAYPDLVYTGYFIPFIEAGLALCLAFPKTRRFAVAGLISMHIFILLALGPIGKNWNAVVWPWNFTMLLGLLILFGKEKEWRPRIKVMPSVYHNLVVLIFGLMPILHSFTSWPGYLSWSIYTNRTSNLLILYDQESYECLPEELQTTLPPAEDQVGSLYLMDWSRKTLGTPHFPHEKVFRAIQADLKQRCPQKQGPDLVIKDRINGEWESRLLE